MGTPKSPSLPIASTEESYAHFLAAHPGLDTFQFIAEQCGVKIERVSAWRPTAPEGSFPNGANLLRLRSTLFIAGYQVTELYQLPANARMLALIVGSGLSDPLPTCKRLGYQSTKELHSLWRILIHAEGFSDPVSKIIDTIVEEYREKLELKRIDIVAQIDKLATMGAAPVETSTTVVKSSLDPAIVAALSRTITTGTALSRIVLDNNGRGELLSQTSGGADVRELIELLQRLVD